MKKYYVGFENSKPYIETDGYVKLYTKRKWPARRFQDVRTVEIKEIKPKKRSKR